MYIKTNIINFVNFNYGGKDSMKDIFPKYLEKATKFCQPSKNWPLAAYTEVKREEVRQLGDLLKAVQVHGRLLDVLVFKNYKKRQPSKQQYERLLETRNLCYSMNQSENLMEFEEKASEFCELVRVIFENDKEDYSRMAGRMKKVVENDHIRLCFKELLGADWNEKN